MQHGKKMEFRLGDTAVGSFSFKKLWDFTPFLDEAGAVRNRSIGVNLRKINAFWFGMGESSESRITRITRIARILVCFVH